MQCNATQIVMHVCSKPGWQISPEEVVEASQALSLRNRSDANAYQPGVVKISKEATTSSVPKSVPVPQDTSPSQNYRADICTLNPKHIPLSSLRHMAQTQNYRAKICHTGEHIPLSRTGVPVISELPGKDMPYR